ncbi:metallophosphoesterase family protein [Salipiger mucosus]|uniref:Metallophosphoesterase n=1 Tax=Salipiger mucosus DSM 16094 TaxID=1123237 RepID=S9R4G2_9RHOB|nr:metallophosphoesterase [Salipiger mucosus]EPX86812.1 metallophosphoesterase [Salipiger mucosus DSM 16094]
MKRVAHVSDLHFGRTDHALRHALIEAVNAAKPDLVAVTGDFTQRARRRQYSAARAFLERIEAPWMAVPGNHDISLDNLWQRFFRPWRRYREFICDDLCPVHVQDGLVVVGLNTVNRFRWQSGRVRWLQMRTVSRVFSEHEGIKVVLAHHPFEQDADIKKTLMRDAERAMERLSDCGADLVLSGHLHRWRTEPFLSAKHGAQVLQVHVGTGLSTRLRGQDNDFALLDLDADTADVTRMVARQGRFVPEGTRHFRVRDGGWVEATGGPVGAPEG